MLKVTNLPQYAEGVEQTYTWLEEALPDGYTISSFVANENGATITNTYEPERFCLTVLKVWDDDNDRDGLRPGSITVSMMQKDPEDPDNLLSVEATDADGNEIETENIVLSADNNWAAMITSLPIFADGEKIEYVWVEDEAIEGYNEGKTL